MNYEFDEPLNLSPDISMTSEIWNIITHNTKYEVSNYGNVKNRKTKRILKCYEKYDNLYVKIEKQPYRICELVAIVFFQKEYPFQYSIDFIDNNKLNCKADNLQLHYMIEL
jgi:hypothetical protein